MKKLVRGVVCLYVFAFFAVFANAQTVVTITDSVKNPDGSPITGTVTLTNSVTMTSSDGYVLPVGSKVSATTTSSGQFTIQLVPNIGAAPSGSFYYADWHTSKNNYRETWVIPPSATSLKLADVRVVWNTAPGVMVASSQFKPPPSCDPVIATNTNLVLRYTPTGAPWFCAPDNIGSVSLNLEVPTAADTGKFQWKPKNGLTLTRVSCNTDQGNVQINLEIRNEAAPNNAGTSILSVPLSCGSNTTASTTSFAVNSVPGSTPVALSIVSVSGSPLIVRIHTDYLLN